jgi:hypothetical protein
MRPYLDAMKPVQSAWALVHLIPNPESLVEQVLRDAFEVPFGVERRHAA